MGKIRPIGTIRAPQLVGMYGPGSIVNLEKISVMPSGVNSWSSSTPTISSATFKKEIYADRLIDCAALSQTGVPATLFPKTFVCRLCGTIQDRTHLSEADLKNGFRCYVDQGPLYPSRWIVFCEAGHIADFNYRGFAHSTRDCEERIWLKTGASLTDTYVICECGAKAAMADAYRKKDGQRHCSGRELWTGQRTECSLSSKISMRSASDVYFGAVRSAITIEPESDPLVARVFEVLAIATKAVQDDRVKAKTALQNTKYFENVADEDVDRALDAFFKAQQEPAEYRNRRYQEYEALARSCGSPKDDLYVETIDSQDLSRFGISGLHAVRKLREVRALVGFKRGGMPLDPAFDDASTALDVLASLGKEGVYPAYENRGEGVFLTFDSGCLRQWISRAEVTRRVQAFVNAEKKWRTYGPD